MLAASDFSPPVPKPNPKPLLEMGLSDNLRVVLGMAVNPIETLSAYQFQLPVFQYTLFGHHFTVVNDPDMIRHCFVKNAQNYRLEPIRQRILTPVLRNGIIATEGETWKTARKVLAPIFTPKYTYALSPRMQAVAQRVIPDLVIPGQKVKMTDIASACTYHILSETLFSSEISEDAHGMMADVAAFFDYLGNVDPLDLLQAPDWLPRPSRLKGGRAVKRLRDRIAALIQKRISRQKRGDTLPDDFLTRLLDGQKHHPDLIHADIEDHILTFIAAGHETTARSLAWLLYLLSHSPTWKAGVMREIDALDCDTVNPSEWTRHMPVTLACFDEAMRLFPPAPFITRQAKADDQFNLVFVPAGGNMFLNLYALHRHETLWDDPARFDPTRFLGEAKAKIKRFQYLPFGVGHRVCIGAPFAVQEALIILVTLLKQFDFDYASDTPPVPVMRITLKPDNGIPMVLTSR